MTDTSKEAPAEPVLVKERRGAVQVLRLNRPEARNALNPELLSAIGLAMLEAEKDHDVRAVVLTGTGDRAFCAGMDLRGFAEGGSGGMSGNPDAMRGFVRFTNGEIAVPIVGAANATAVAGGFELLLGCDVVVASDAALFGVPEVKRGLFAAGGGVFISTRIPLAVALELTLTGDSIDAGRALALGLINQVVPPAEVLDAAVALAERIAGTAPSRCTRPNRWCARRRPTSSAPRCWRPNGSPRCSAARTPKRVPPPSLRSATPCGRAAELTRQVLPVPGVGDDSEGCPCCVGRASGWGLSSGTVTRATTTSSRFRSAAESTRSIWLWRIR